MTIGILITHPSHVFWAKEKYPDALLIARDLLTILVHPNEKIEYLHPKPNFSSVQEKTVIDLANNWYRDSEGTDVSCSDGMSSPQVLTGSIRYGIASCIREYEALKFWKGMLSKMMVSTSENRLFLNACLEFETFIDYYEPPSLLPSVSEWLQERKLKDSWDLGRKWLNPFTLKTIVFLQRMFFPGTKKNSLLIFSDWTNYSLNISTNTLWTNRINPRKCAYIVANRNESRKSRGRNTTSIESKLNEVLITRLSECDQYQIDDPLKRVIRNYIMELVDSSREIIDIFDVKMRNLLKNYSVESILIPAELYEPYIVALQHARSNGLTSTLLVDGHDPTGMAVPTLHTANGKQFLLSQFGVCSNALYQNALHMGFSKDQIQLFDSPFLKLHSSTTQKNYEYDVIIMTWIPNQQNPSARIDSPSATLRDALLVTSRLFDGTIAVKVKDHSLESEYVEQIINVMGLSERVKVITGRFCDHIKKAKIIIGGISSAIAECKIHDIPYIIYEPIENGYGEMYFEGNYLLKRSRIARTVAELESLIALGEPSVDIDREEYLFSSGRIN
jgi:hypothetical protein